MKKLSVNSPARGVLALACALIPLTAPLTRAQHPVPAPRRDAAQPTRARQDASRLPPPASPDASRLPPPAARPEPGSQLTVYLMTMGVGAEVWEQFGHNALWFHDGISGQDAVYNWGLFDFNAPHFIPHFLQGLMRYSMGGFDLQSTLEEYRERDRSVWAQELDLTPAQKLSMLQYVEWNALPENRDYWYNYYTDNCSTRVRDVIDRTLGGQLRAATDRKMTGTTYRTESLRLTQVDLPLAAGIDIGLGRPGDHELSAWQQMFVPMRLRDEARALRIRVDASGATKPLVKSERELYVSRTHDDPARPPVYTPWFLAAGIVVAVVFLALGRAAERGARGARAATAIVFAIWALLAGFFGTLLVLLWTVTNHTFAWHNENLLLLNPLWLLLVVLAPLTIARARAVGATSTVATAVAALSAAALVVHPLGLSRQDNIAIIALLLPPALAYGWVVQRVGTSPRPARAS